MSRGRVSAEAAEYEKSCMTRAAEVLRSEWSALLQRNRGLHALDIAERRIASAYIVRKSTVHGIVTSLELYDAQGE
jgi:putative heme degradation protein